MYGIERRFDEIDKPVQRHIHCRSTPLVAYILPTGDISICTLVRAPDFNPQVPEPFLGNLNQNSFFDVWGSERHRTRIEGLSTSGCHRCHFAVYNEAIEMIASDTMHASFL